MLPPQRHIVSPPPPCQPSHRTSDLVFTLSRSNFTRARFVKLEKCSKYRCSETRLDSLAMPFRAVGFASSISFADQTHNSVCVLRLERDVHTQKDQISQKPEVGIGPGAGTPTHHSIATISYYSWHGLHWRFKRPRQAKFPPWTYAAWPPQLFRCAPRQYFFPLFQSMFCFGFEAANCHRLPCVTPNPFLTATQSRNDCS